MAKKALATPYNTHKLTIETPHGYCPCVSKTEHAFCEKNREKIERARAKENYRAAQRAAECNNDVGEWKNENLLEPIPNE